MLNTFLTDGMANYTTPRRNMRINRFLGKMLPSGRGCFAPSPASAPETGRNKPCPCGSGKKYKKCHRPVVSSLVSYTEAPKYE